MLFSLAITHRVAPLLENSLLSLSNLPLNQNWSGLIGALRKFRLTRWVPFRQRLIRARSNLVSALEAAGADFAITRGLALAEKYYLFPELRICSDLDVLVRPEHYEHAIETCLRLGFDFLRVPVFRKAQQQYVAQCELLHVATGILIDLNWRFTENAGIGSVSVNMNQVWERAVPKKGSDCEYALAPEDHLLHVIRHVSQGHDFERGMAVACCDVAQLIRTNPEMDWTYIEVQSKISESTHAVAHFLSYFRMLYPWSENPQATRFTSQSTGLLCANESCVFTFLIIEPQIWLAAMPQTGLVSWIRANLILTAKFWLLDQTTRMLSLLRVCAWASSVERVLLSDEHSAASALIQQISLWGHLLLTLPGITLGILMRFGAMSLACLRRERFG